MSMMIALSAIEYDPDGAGVLALRPDSHAASRTGGRRQTKTATLDGGVSLYDTGYTITDQAWQVKVASYPEAERLIDHLCRNYQRIRVSTDFRHVEASIASWSVDGTDINVRLSVLEEL